MRQQVGLWRLIVFSTGVALVFIVASVQALLPERLLIVVPAASYSIIGAVLGFLYPERGWRTGFWLVLFFLILLPLNALFVESPPPCVWQREAKGLLEDAVIVSLAFIGAATGSFVRQRMTRRTA